MDASAKGRFGALPKVPGCRIHKHRKFRMVVQREAEVFECLKCNLNLGILHEWRQTMQSSRDAIVDLGTMKSYAKLGSLVNDDFGAEAAKGWLGRKDPEHLLCKIEKGIRGTCIRSKEFV